MARRRLILGTLAGLLLVAAVVIAGGILYLRGVKPDYDRAVAAAGVGAPVEVWRDSAGVPHLWAASERDLYFAQGYVHAQERLWQMELFRRVAEGRLAEVLGEGLVETDRFLRTVGLWQAAALNERHLDEPAHAALEAYAAGVNHWLATRSGPLPPEFIVLRIRPEPWTVRHSLAVEKVMSWDLAHYYGAVALTNAARRLGEDKLRYVEPADPPWGRTIVESPAPPAVPAAAAVLVESLSAAHGSNAWVIGGTRTASGKPILANDMHLALRQPGVWYLMALHAPALDVAGMTLPGVPNVIAGHNRAVAWGFTNVMLDDVDFFIERVDPTDTTRYLTPAGPQFFETRTESVRVKGRSQPYTFVVRSTRHGPVISDVEARLRGGDVLAMRWASLDSTRSLRAFPLINRARNAEELLAALPLFDNPHQNVVYADTAGRFGYQMAGRVPLRGARRRPPILPVPGWTGEWDWQGYLPFAEHPAVRDPVVGYAVTANNRQARGAIGDLISNDWDLPFRAMRIAEMIEGGNRNGGPLHDAGSVHAMQLDVKDLLAVRYREHAVRAARAAGLREPARLLESWDGVAAAESAAAAWFYAWYETLRRDVARSLFRGQAGSMGRGPLNRVLEAGTLGWLGEPGRAALDSLARSAALRADSIARGRTWGDLHTVVIRHALAEAAPVEKLLDLNVGPRPHRGSTTTVNVAQYGSGDFPVTTSYGASQRHVVDMADVDGAGGFILPAGQSGLPASEHYGDMFARWHNGGLWRIPLDRRAAQARIVHRSVIRPGN